MSHDPTGILVRMRSFLGRGKVIIVTGAIYLASQVTILTVPDPLGPEVLNLQTTFSPEVFA
ncbi:hypothetical protein RHODOSMS8_02437 [Rhodobiaceae bacterium]|nr:hypothetical protein RHODOSMS8_02437 [Rhodobiaceae bacterium]